MTGIEWTDETWNPTTGCDRVSPGCDNCYALTMAGRLKAMGQPGYQNDGDPRTSGPGFGLTVHEDRLDAPLRWRKPRRVFVNSMSDLFHPKVPDEFIARVFGVMMAAPQHTFQVLTKRPKRMRALLNDGDFDSEVARWWDDAARLEGWAVTPPFPPVNVWLGTSVEDQQRADERIPALLDTPAAVRFLSCEPLLGPVDLSRWLGVERMDVLVDEGNPEGWGAEMFATLQGQLGGGLGWVIVGGESGPGARPMNLAWAHSIVEQCRAAEVPVFVKQLGSAPFVVVNDEGRQAPWPSSGKGGDMDGWPEWLQVREFPVEAVEVTS